MLRYDETDNHNTNEEQEDIPPEFDDEELAAYAEECLNHTSSDDYDFGWSDFEDAVTVTPVKRKGKEVVRDDDADVDMRA